MQTKMLNILSGIVVVGATLALVLVYPSMPDIIPTHYGWDGAADAWGDKSEVWLPAAVNVGMYLLATILERYYRYYNYPVVVTEHNRERLYALGRSYIAILKLLLALLLSWLTFSWRSERLSVIPTGISIVAILGVSIYYIIRMYQAK